MKIGWKQRQVKTNFAKPVNATGSLERLINKCQDIDKRPSATEEKGYDTELKDSGVNRAMFR